MTAGDGTRAAAIATAVATRRKARTAFLAELVRTPSDNPPGDCAAHAEKAASLLEGLGFEVERHGVPSEAAHAAAMVSVTNLVVRRRYGPGPVVALNAHGDAVPPGTGWSHDPYGAEIVDGRLYGRGAAVSKSDFATYAFAVLALEEAALPKAGTVELHFTYDEETGGELGPKWLLEHGLTAPDYVISAGFAHGVGIAHNGCLHLAARISGRQAHAALPETGVDALVAATDVLTALYLFRQRLGRRHSMVPGIDSPTLVVGRIEGGVNTNVVPDLVTLRLDRRVIPEESSTEAEAELRDLIQGAVAHHPGARVEIERTLLALPLRPVEGNRLAGVLCRCASAVLGEAVAQRGTPLYTDARHYAAAGIPTVLYGAGPRTVIEAGAHGADENLLLDDLDRATRVVAGALAELLG